MDQPALQQAQAAAGEVSGHYHPKARLVLRGRVLSRPCFLMDARRLILPAYGAYAGGLRSDSPVLDALMGPEAVAERAAAPPTGVEAPKLRYPAETAERVRPPNR